MKNIIISSLVVFNAGTLLAANNEKISVRKLAQAAIERIEASEEGSKILDEEVSLRKLSQQALKQAEKAEGVSISLSDYEKVKDKLISLKESNNQSENEEFETTYEDLEQVLQKMLETSQKVRRDILKKAKAVKDEDKQAYQTYNKAADIYESLATKARFLIRKVEKELGDSETTE